MTRPRVPETDKGIQGQENVATYDQMQRNQKERGWGIAPQLIKYGITSGVALEIGHGPGYLGLEWLKATRNTRLTGIDISSEMTHLAERNAAEYGLSGRTTYQGGSGDLLPFGDNSFDAVFTNGSLHEWAHPVETFNEIWRVLKPGGTYVISDLRRDMNIFIQWFLWFQVKPAYIRPYMFSSIRAAYIPEELLKMAGSTNLKGATISSNWINLVLRGNK
jgi:ubiquinone/menaquinone biosynthesis C-methylase UbiE